MSAPASAAARPGGRVADRARSSATTRSCSSTARAIHIIHQPAAHTDGDSIVFFRRSDVISTGDIFTTTNYPVIDLAAGGTINGIIDGAEPASST